jgi:microcystin-dependent protein
MSQPFIGEIRMFGGNFAPAGWMLCQGQVIPISENDTLFNLIGTTYGGDGQETFALPNLQGRVPIHMGQSSGTSNYLIGESGGVESVTLTTQQIPSHTHPPIANNGTGTSTNPANNVWAAQPALLQYNPAGTEDSPLRNNAIQQAGGSQPHDNMMPYLAVNYIISLFGVYPTQN